MGVGGVSMGWRGGGEVGRLGEGRGGAYVGSGDWVGGLVWVWERWWSRGGAYQGRLCRCG